MHKKEHKIDYVGSALIFISISAIMVVFIQAGTVWSWYSAPVLLLLGVFLAGTYFFVMQEKRASEPIMPLEIWRDPLIVVANLATLTTGVVLIGVASFLPTYIQGVMGKSPIIAGFALSFMSIGWIIGATVAGKVMLKYGFRRIAVVGGSWILMGSVFFITLRPERGWLWAGMGCLLIGLGMGLARTVFILGIQNNVKWERRGVATASNMFMNILGNAMGAAVLGGILNSALTRYLQGFSRDTFNIDVINVLLDPVKRRMLPQEVLQIMTSGLAIALQYVFWGLFSLAVLSFILMLFFPAERRDAA